MRISHFWAVLFLCLFGACSKNGSNPAATKESLTDLAKSWYEENTNLTFELNWNEAVLAKGNKKLLIPFNWSAKLDSFGNAKRLLVVYNDEKAKPYKAEIVEIIPLSPYSKIYGDTYIKGLFTGTLALYDIEMNFQYGQFYKNGVIKYNSEVEKFKSRAEATARPQTESVNCSWIQSGFVDTDGVFTRVNTWVCSVTGGGNGSDPGVDPAINCKIDPDNPTNCEVQNGYQEPEEYPGDNLNGIESICESTIKFKKVLELENGVGGWQIAGVEDVHMNVVNSVTKEVYRVTPGPVVYFGLPIVGGGQGNISQAYASIIAKNAVDYAEEETGKKIANGTINKMSANAEFRKDMNYYMALYGGRANLSEPGLSISVTPAKAKYGIIGQIGCP